MSFPTLRNTPQFNSSSPQYYSPSGINVPAGYQNQPTVTSAAMTYEGTLTRAAIGFVVLLAAAGIAWFVPVLVIPGLIVGLVLGLVIAFKRITNPAAVLSYAAAEGLVVGGLSGLMERIYPGIASQAVLATLVVFAVVMFLYRVNIFRATPRMTKIFIIASISYALFGLINLALMLTGVTTGMFGMYSDLGFWGIAIGVLGVLLASYSLVLDFTYIDNGVNNKAEAKWEWFAAFSLIGTLVWLYVEVLRLLALFRN